MPGEIATTQGPLSTNIEQVLLGGDLSPIAGATIVCIGPIVAETAREFGLTPHVVAEERTIDGMVAALRAHLLHSTHDSTPAR